MNIRRWSNWSMEELIYNNMLNRYMNSWSWSCHHFWSVLSLVCACMSHGTIDNSAHAIARFIQCLLWHILISKWNLRICAAYPYIERSKGQIDRFVCFLSFLNLIVVLADVCVCADDHIHYLRCSLHIAATWMSVRTRARGLPSDVTCPSSSLCR